MVAAESRCPAAGARVELVAAPVRRPQARHTKAWATAHPHGSAVLPQPETGLPRSAARVAASAPRILAWVARTATDSPARPRLAPRPARQEARPARQKEWPTLAPAAFAPGPPSGRPPFAAAAPPS